MSRVSELATQQDDDEQPERASVADLDALRAATFRRAQTSVTPSADKGVLQAMIDGLRVDARDQIEPTSAYPRFAFVSGYMEPADLKSNRSARLPGGRMLLDDAD